MKRIIVLIGLSLMVVKSEINESCTTSTNQVGRCVPVRSCEFVLNIFRSDPPYSQDDINFIEYNECGEIRNETLPKKLVCCPAFHNVKGCGQAKINNRIFGGEDTKLGEFPWAGLIVYKISRTRFATKCGCTLLNSRWTVTAAHCISNVPSSWKLSAVRFSEWNTSKNCSFHEDKTVCRQEYKIEQHIVHPSYQMDADNMRHDIALLKTEQEVEMNTYVVPICLPYTASIRELPIEQTTFTVTGWGQTEKGSSAKIQQSVELVGQNNSVCDKAFAPLKITLSDEQICIGGQAAKDSCRGDSGGPLTLENELVNYLIGIVSFGARECGTKDNPGVYTYVVK